MASHLLLAKSKDSTSRRSARPQSGSSSNCGTRDSSDSRCDRSVSQPDCVSSCDGVTVSAPHCEHRTRFAGKSRKDVAYENKTRCRHPREGDLPRTPDGPLGLLTPNDRPSNLPWVRRSRPRETSDGTRSEGLNPTPSFLEGPEGGDPAQSGRISAIPWKPACAGMTGRRLA